MLARHRAALGGGPGQQLVGGGAGARHGRGVGAVDEEGRVEVAVAGVAPRGGGQVVARAERARLADEVGQALDRDGDVLAELAAVLGRDRGRDAVAPAPQRTRVGRGGGDEDGARALRQDLAQRLGAARRLGRRALGLGQDHERRGRPELAEREGARGRGRGRLVEDVEDGGAQARGQDVEDRRAAGLRVRVGGHDAHARPRAPARAAATPP